MLIKKHIALLTVWSLLQSPTLESATYPHKTVYPSATSYGSFESLLMAAIGGCCIAVINRAVHCFTPSSTPKIAIQNTSSIDTAPTKITPHTTYQKHHPTISAHNNSVIQHRNTPLHQSGHKEVTPPDSTTPRNTTTPHTSHRLIMQASKNDYTNAQHTPAVIPPPAEHYLPVITDKKNNLLDHNNPIILPLPTEIMAPEKQVSQQTSMAQGASDNTNNIDAYLPHTDATDLFSSTTSRSIQKTEATSGQKKEMLYNQVQRRKKTHNTAGIHKEVKKRIMQKFQRANTIKGTTKGSVFSATNVDLKTAYAASILTEQSTQLINDSIGCSTAPVDQNQQKKPGACVAFFTASTQYPTLKKKLVDEYLCLLQVIPIHAQPNASSSMHDHHHTSSSTLTGQSMFDTWLGASPEKSNYASSQHVLLLLGRILLNQTPLIKQSLLIQLHRTSPNLVQRLTPKIEYPLYSSISRFTLKNALSERSMSTAIIEHIRTLSIMPNQIKTVKKQRARFTLLTLMFEPHPSRIVMHVHTNIPRLIDFGPINNLAIDTVHNTDHQTNFLAGIQARHSLLLFLAKGAATYAQNNDTSLFLHVKKTDHTRTTTSLEKASPHQIHRFGRQFKPIWNPFNTRNCIFQPRISTKTLLNKVTRTGLFILRSL